MRCFNHLPPWCVELDEEVVVLCDGFIEVVISQYEHIILENILRSDVLQHESECYGGKGFQTFEHNSV